MDRYVIGVDFGSDSVRAVVLNAETGAQESTDVAYYPRWMEQKYCDAAKNQFRQHPLDHLESLEACVKSALAKLPAGTADRVAALGIDTTGSTPCAVDEEGVPLALHPRFADNPNAMFILWKDHTAVREAAEINQAAWNNDVDYTKYVGGIYSSEWFWAKILHVLREDPQVREAAASWVEHCDWVPAVLTDTQHPQRLKRSRCAAGHKAMWHAEWGGLPSDAFWQSVDPLLGGLRDRLYDETHTSDQKAGDLTPAWAERLGLPEGIAVAVGAFDAHMGAVGAGIGKGSMVKIMGTSTCDVMVAPYEVIGDKQVKGICGQVDGSVIPGMIGLEAGQSALGDVYAWFRDLLAWPLEAVAEENGLEPQLAEAVADNILPALTNAAENLQPGEAGVLSLDWLNGRRTPDADQELKGAALGLTLGTTAPRLFRSLVEATCYGARATADRFRSEGVEIEEVIAIGGIPQKNALVMQTHADVLNMPIRIAAAEQAVALGAGMFGAVAAEVYRDVEQAKEHMNSGFSHTYHPDSGRVAAYQKLYEQYLGIGTMLEDTLRGL